MPIYHPIITTHCRNDTSNWNVQFGDVRDQVGTYIYYILYNIYIYIYIYLFYAICVHMLYGIYIFSLTLFSISANIAFEVFLL